MLLEIETASSLTSASQWARERRNADQERDSDLGPEDYFEGALRGNREGDTLDDITETLILVMLCLAISVLLYVRARIVDRLRREDQRPEEQRQPHANQGDVPPPEDAAQNDWVVVR